MTIEAILDAVSVAFGEEISTSAAETVLGLESFLDGKDEFFAKLKTRLEALELQDKTK